MFARSSTPARNLHHPSIPQRNEDSFVSSAASNQTTVWIVWPWQETWTKDAAGPTKDWVRRTRRRRTEPGGAVRQRRRGVGLSPTRVSETALAFEPFPDEDYGKDPVLRTESDRGPIRLFEVRKTPTEPTAPQPATGKIRPGMLLLFFAAAAFAAFGTVRACQVNGVSSVAVWQQPGH